MGNQSLRDVITAIRATAEAGELPLVVFDLDSTLFSTGERNLRILHEFAQAQQAEHPDLRQRIADLEAEDIGWGVDDCLRDRGVEDEELLKALMKFWMHRFFTDAYCELDAATPGAVDYVTACHEAGALIYYLTGRDVSNMELGTLRSLRHHGFPLSHGRCVLHLKPFFETPDKVFKDGAMANIRSLGGRVVATFENEPGNANLFLRAFPDARHFLLETIHSKEPEEPAEALIRTADLTLAKA